MKKTLINLSIPVLAALFIAGVILATNTFPTTLNDWSSGETIESDWADALETKIGADSSAVTTSLDYLLTSASSVDPGHIHYGDPSPDAILEVVSSGGSDLFMLSTTTASDGDVFIVNNAGNVGIGTTTPDYKLEVDGILDATTLSINSAITFPNYAGTNGQWLKIDGSGNLYWTSSSFQIPAHEVIDPISGELIEPGDFVLGTIDYTLPDGALHGLWTKFDNVKEELCPSNLEDRIEALENKIEELELSRWDKLINYFK